MASEHTFYPSSVFEQINDSCKLPCLLWPVLVSRSYCSHSQRNEVWNVTNFPAHQNMFRNRRWPTLGHAQSQPARRLLKSSRHHSSFFTGLLIGWEWFPDLMDTTLRVALLVALLMDLFIAVIQSELRTTRRYYLKPISGAMSKALSGPWMEVGCAR